MTETDAWQLAGAALGAVLTTGGALALWAIDRSRRRRDVGRTAVEALCDEMLENVNQLNLILMALGMTRDLPDKSKPRKTPEEEGHHRRVLSFLPFDVSSRQFEQLQQLDAPSGLVSAVRAKVRSSYGLIAQVGHFLQEYRALAQAEASRNEVRDWFLGGELLFVRARNRQLADAKKLANDHGVSLHLPIASSLFGAMFFEPSSETKKQLEFADTIGKDLLAAIRGDANPKEEKDQPSPPHVK